MVVVGSSHDRTFLIKELNCTEILKTQSYELFMSKLHCIQWDYLIVMCVYRIAAFVHWVFENSFIYFTQK